MQTRTSAHDGSLGTIDLAAVRDALDALPNGGATVDPTAPRAYSFYRDFQQGLRYERQVKAYKSLHKAARIKDNGLDPKKLS